MKSNSTYKEKLTSVFCFSVLFLVFCKTEVCAQVNLVNANGLVSSSHVSNAGNAAVFDNTFCYSKFIWRCCNWNWSI